MNRYEVFMKVIEKESFTDAAADLGYTQSAVSQLVKALEDELSTTLIVRSRKGISLTADGKEYLPFINNIRNAYWELMEKRKEMTGLESGIIRIGTISSVSANWLPKLMKDFKEIYPSVQFQLHQGAEYSEIEQFIKEGTVDFGFLNPDATKDLETNPLTKDEMLAVLPMNHPLVNEETVSLIQLATESYILLEEGHLNEPLEFFKQHQLQPNIQFRVHDDYTIMAMVENGLGISVLPELVLKRVNYQLVKKKITPPVTRTISIAYKDKRILPIASRHFIDFLIERFK